MLQESNVNKELTKHLAIRGKSTGSEGLLKTKKKEGSVTDQTWVHSPRHSKASLLTPGCSEVKCGVYCRCRTRSLAQLVLKKTPTPQWVLARHFKGKVREGQPRVCDELVHSSLICEISLIVR